MTISEIKKKYRAKFEAIGNLIANPTTRISKRDELLIEYATISEILTDLNNVPSCNGVKIDYVKETCTSCGCKNHKTE